MINDVDSFLLGKICFSSACKGSAPFWKAACSNGHCLFWEGGITACPDSLRHFFVWAISCFRGVKMLTRMACALLRSFGQVKTDGKNRVQKK